VAVLPTRGAGADVQSFSISVTGTAGNFFYDSSNANAVLSQDWYVNPTYEHVGVTASIGDSRYSFDFATPKGGGQRLVTGFYQWAQDYPFNDPGRPGIAVHGNSAGCSNQTGNFEVRDIARSGLLITRLWLVWERWCGSVIGPSSWVEFGELRLGYPQAAYDVSPRVVVWPWSTIYPGDAAPAVPVRVRLTSSDTVTADTPSVSGADADDFPIRQQDCTGTLTASGCTVWVGFNPSAPGPRHAILTVPTTTGATSVSLDGTGGLGTSDWNVTINQSDPPQTRQLVMDSASVGGPYEIRTQAFEPSRTGRTCFGTRDSYKTTARR
jgi:hypothetical protein